MIENKNPNFFKASSNVSEPEVQAIAAEEADIEAETERREPVISASPTKSLKFYKNEEFKQLEHTPGFQDSNEKKSKEIEKSVSKSKEKSEEKSKKSPKVIMKFNLSDDHEDDVVVQNVFEDSQTKQRKHKFIEEFNDQNEYQSNEVYDSSHKVEETPENNDAAEELEEQDYAAKDVVRSSLQRKYKAWDRSDYKSKYNLILILM